MAIDCMLKMQPKPALLSGPRPPAKVEAVVGPGPKEPESLEARSEVRATFFRPSKH